MNLQRVGGKVPNEPQQLLLRDAWGFGDLGCHDDDRRKVDVPIAQVREDRAQLSGRIRLLKDGTPEIAQHGEVAGLNGLVPRAEGRANKHEKNLRLGDVKSDCSGLLGPGRGLLGLSRLFGSSDAAKQDQKGDAKAGKRSRHLAFLRAMGMPSRPRLGVIARASPSCHYANSSAHFAVAEAKADPSSQRNGIIEPK